MEPMGSLGATRKGLPMTDRERLERFEAVLAVLQAEQATVEATMEELRAKDRVKSATYQQLMARKLTLRTLAALFERHGLL